jgi:hypothetical protein
MIVWIVLWLIFGLCLCYAVFVIAALIANDRDKQRFKEMREEADRKRDDYFILSDKIDEWRPARRNGRRRFLP